MTARVSPQTLYRLGLAAYVYCFAVVLWHTVSVLYKDYTQTAAYNAVTWNVSNYFVSYSGGFVRRGLPGAAFNLFATPNKSSAFTMFWVLTALSYIGVLSAAFVVTRAVARKRYLPFVWLIALISPFALNALAANEDNAYLGRYDGICAMAMVALVLVGWTIRVDHRRALSASHSRRRIRNDAAGLCGHFERRVHVRLHHSGAARVCLSRHHCASLRIQTGGDPDRRRSDLCGLESDRACPSVDDRSSAERRRRSQRRVRCGVCAGHDLVRRAPFRRCVRCWECRVQHRHVVRPLSDDLRGFEVLDPNAMALVLGLCGVLRGDRLRRQPARHRLSQVVAARADRAVGDSGAATAGGARPGSERFASRSAGAPRRGSRRYWWDASPSS